MFSGKSQSFCYSKCQTENKCLAFEFTETPSDTAEVINGRTLIKKETITKITNIQDRLQSHRTKPKPKPNTPDFKPFRIDPDVPVSDLTCKLFGFDDSEICDDLLIAGKLAVGALWGMFLLKGGAVADVIGCVMDAGNVLIDVFDLGMDLVHDI